MPRGYGHGMMSVLVSTAVAGCAMDRLENAPPDPRPLGRELPSFQAPPGLPPSGAAWDFPEEPTGLLTLRDALALALMRNPELAAISWEVRVAEARALQAQRPPNPEMGLSLEDFAGSGAQAGLKAAELALELSQVVELGGKRLQRARVAQWERDLIAWDYEAKRLEVYTATARAYIEVLAAEKRLTLAQETLALAERARQAVVERVRAGKAAPVEESKAMVELAGRRVAAERAQRELQVARGALAALWGNPEPRFTRVEGDLARVHPVPAFERLVVHLSQNPDLARWTAEMALRRALVASAESTAIPDVTVIAGLKHAEEYNSRTGILGLSIPLPILDRNQGGILESRYRLAKTEAERRAVQVRVATELYRAWQSLAQTQHEAATLQEQALPAARRAFQIAQEGYRQGKWGYLEVLDAQRSLFDTQAQAIDALANYHKALADAERLIGESLDSLTAATVPAR